MLAGKNNASSAARRLPNREAALEQLYSEISAKHMFPFWATSTDVAHDEIKLLMGTQKAVPHLWSYKHDIEPILYRAAELVTMDDSERRSLILVNRTRHPLAWTRARANALRGRRDDAVTFPAAESGKTPRVAPWSAVHRGTSSPPRPPSPDRGPKAGPATMRPSGCTGRAAS